MIHNILIFNFFILWLMIRQLLNRERIMKELRFATKDSAIKFLSSVVYKCLKLAAANIESTEESKFEDIIKESRKIQKEYKKLEEIQNDLIKKFMKNKERLQAEMKEIEESLAELDKQQKTNNASYENAIQYLADLTGMKVVIEKF
jgi:hypothetical protein